MTGRLRQVRRLSVLLVLVAALGVSVRCAPPPPNLTPQASVAFQNTEVLKTLDLIRDLAADGAHTGVISRADALLIVNWHTAAIRIMDARTSNYAVQITTGFDQVLAQLAPPVHERFAPYLTLLRTVLGLLPR
jgi:hypothetical protein